MDYIKLKCIVILKINISRNKMITINDFIKSNMINSNNNNNPGKNNQSNC